MKKKILPGTLNCSGMWFMVLYGLHHLPPRINQRKKEAMQCYTNSLNKSPPNTHRVQKCLQKLLRSMHKDRSAAILHAPISSLVLPSSASLFKWFSLFSACG